PPTRTVHLSRRRAHALEGDARPREHHATYAYATRPPPQADDPVGDGHQLALPLLPRRLHPQPDHTLRQLRVAVPARRGGVRHPRFAVVLPPDLGPERAGAEGARARPHG